MKADCHSLKSGNWWPAALQACQLRQPGSIVAFRFRSGSIAAHTTKAAERYGLPAGVPVVLAGNDQTSGAYATERPETGNGLLLTLGSAQVVYACLPRMCQQAAQAILIRGPSTGGLGYRMTADNAGGNIVNWAETILSGCETPAAKFYSHAAAKSATRDVRLIEIRTFLRKVIAPRGRMPACITRPRISPGRFWNG